MTSPIRSVDGNVVWTRTGEVLAVWKITPPTTPRMPVRERNAWHHRVTAALMSMPASSMILGITRPVNADHVVRRMVKGLDIRHHPDYAAQVREHRDHLRQAQLTERGLYLATELPSTRGRRWSNALASANARVTGFFSIPALPPTRSEKRVAHQDARDIYKPLASFLGEGGVDPISEAELLWLYARASYRGTAQEPTVEDLNFGGGTLGGPSLVSLDQAVAFEGGVATDDDRPAHQRFTVMVNESGLSYQTFLTLAVLPQEWVYPYGQGACLSRLAQLGYPLDWSVRIRPTANYEAQTKITADIRKLAGQFEEYTGDLAGAPESLPMALQKLREEVGRLSGSPSIPELQATITVCLAAPTLALLEEWSGHVRKVLEANEFNAPRPFGDQDELYDLMQIGAPLTGVGQDYTQFLLPEDLAGLDPFAGSDLGDPQGPLLGLNLDDSQAPVLFSTAYGPSVPPPRGPLSGSVGIIGKVRSGKSHLGKVLIRDTIATGGQVCVTDRTTMGEYVRLAPLLPGRSQVVEITTDSKVCLDPLKVFAGEAATRYATGFLTLLTNTPPTSVAGIALSDAVTRTASGGGRLADVAVALTASDEPEAKMLARKLDVLSRSVGLGRCAFGEGTPVRFDADYIVFHIPALDLPPRHVLSNPVLAAQLLPEQVFSVALLYLITAVQCSVAFRDRSRFTLVCVDEVHVITDSPQGEQMLLKVAKDGPKHNAGLLIIGHLPSEIPESITDALGTRFMFRMAKASAPAGLRWLDLEPTQRAVETIIEENRSAGECLMVDRYGRAGLVLCLQPTDPDWVAALDTTPSHASSSAVRSTHRVRRPSAEPVLA